MTQEQFNELLHSQQGELDAVGYEHLIADFPEVESVKDDEKRHGDIVSGLLDT